MGVTPNSQEQADLTMAFLSMVKGGNSEKTRLITSENKYRVADLCSTSKASLLVPGLTILNDSEENRQTVVASAQMLTSKIKEKQASCDSTPQSLVDLITKISDAADKERLIILIQAPWNEQSLNDEILRKIADANLHLSKKKSVDKILLFGVSPQSASKLSKSFEVFNLERKEVFDSPAGLDNSQLNSKIESIRLKLLLDNK